MLQKLDPTLSKILKEAGIAKAAENSGEKWLPVLKGIARHLARRYDIADADMVHQFALENELGIPKGPFWGAIFKGEEWEFTGTRIVSRQPNNHGREIKTWRLREESGRSDIGNWA